MHLSRHRLMVLRGISALLGVTVKKDPHLSNRVTPGITHDLKVHYFLRIHRILQLHEKKWQRFWCVCRIISHSPNVLNAISAMSLEQLVEATVYKNNVIMFSASSNYTLNKLQYWYVICQNFTPCEHSAQGHDILWPTSLPFRAPRWSWVNVWEYWPSFNLKRADLNRNNVASVPFLD